MKILRSALRHGDIWTVPTKFLTPLAQPEMPPTPRDLWEDIDANGMRNPLVCWPMTAGTWARWCTCRPRARMVVPSWVLGGIPMKSASEVDHGARVLSDHGLLWVVHVGNQRLAYAEARGYTHVDAVLCPDHVKAVEWVSSFYAR